MGWFNRRKKTLVYDIPVEASGELILIDADLQSISASLFATQADVERAEMWRRRYAEVTVTRSVLYDKIIHAIVSPEDLEKMDRRVTYHFDHYVNKLYITASKVA